MKFQKFPSLEHFREVYSSLRRTFVNDRPTIDYQGKTKIHGKNAGVHLHVEGGSVTVTAMKRTAFISPENDNAGFASWLEGHKSVFQNHALLWSGAKDVTVFGEWAGPGVQKGGDAVSKIPEKTFFVFSIRYGDDRFIFDPIVIEMLLPQVPNMKIIPWATDLVVCDFASLESIEAFTKATSKDVEQYETEDPYIKAEFGISAPGEGLVYYPVSSNDPKKVDCTNVCFKAKTERHRVSGQRGEYVAIDPVVHSKVMEFAREFVTEARFEQAISETVGHMEKTDISLKNLGQLLKWMNSDVFKECQVSLEASGLDWKMVSREVSKLTKSMFEKYLMSV